METKDAKHGGKTMKLDSTTNHQALVQNFKACMKARRAAARKEIRKRVKEILVTLYKNHGNRMGYTVTLMRDDLAQTASWRTGEAFQFLSKRNQAAVVRSVLESLVREGFAGKVTGLGLHGGEAQEYELVATPAAV